MGLTPAWWLIDKSALARLTQRAVYEAAWPRMVEGKIGVSICTELAIKNDLAQGAQPDFNPTLALDTGELVTFLGADAQERQRFIAQRWSGQV